MDYNRTELKHSRAAYVAEATFEYLIAILVQGTFLAQLTMNIGFTDSQTGIISSVISLGCVFQLGSLFYRKKAYKKFVFGMSVSNQLLFVLLYVLPVAPLHADLKKVLFLVFIFSAYILYYLVHPKKINWFMSLIDDKKRGSFIAVKEMVSLAIGIIFSFAMGHVIDTYKANGQIGTAFTIGACVATGLMILHSVTMAVSAELPPEEKKEKVSFKTFFNNLLSVIKQKDIAKVVGIFVFWYLISYGTTSFYGTFQLRELGLNQSTTTVLVCVGNLCRIGFSRPMGHLADRFSFVYMIRICLGAAALGFLCVMFASPGNGLICFLLYYIFYGFAMSGINSALTNLVFDYAPHSLRSDALAVCQSLGGICGFLSTLAASALVNTTQNSGIILGGIRVYAQQILSAVATVLTVGTIIFILIAFPKKQQKGDVK